VAYSAVSRKYTISLTMAAGSTTVPVEVRTFAAKSGALPANVTLQGGFSDSHEILGARPIRVVDNAAASLIGELAGGVNTLISFYPASLSSLDAVYLHMNTIETGNFMSTGHESHAQDSLRLIESSLFARIPFDRSSFDEVHEVVSFEDNGGDSYQSFLSRKTIDTLDIRVTDARGRSLASLDPTQADEGLMAFRLCLRWDLFAPPPMPTPRSEVVHEKPPMYC